MPNHVKNIVKMEGIGNLPLFVVEDGEKCFDFNKLIPMPESLNVKTGSITEQAVIYYLTDRCTKSIRSLSDDVNETLKKLVKNSFGGGKWQEEVFLRVFDWSRSNTDEQNEELYSLGKTYVENYEKYGATDWYDWRVENWGTKWNAYDCEIEEDQITFETAWCCPEPVIRKLAETYPDSYIEHMWADEGLGQNSGYMEYHDGQEYGGYDETDKEAYEHYVECWGTSNCCYLDDNDRIRRRDCDTCNGCD